MGSPSIAGPVPLVTRARPFDLSIMPESSCVHTGSLVVMFGCLAGIVEATSMPECNYTDRAAPCALDLDLAFPGRSR